jgi:GR25 family glycosyltransferase involved in LPS biosynthesis
MKYTIIHVNDRSIKNINKNKKILSSFEYIDDIVFFNGNIGNSWDVINHKGIPQDRWKPYDGRSHPPLPGELGVWVSTINAWEYMLDNKIDRMLVLEDDVILQEDFIKKLDVCLKELPKDFDFLSLYYFTEHNQVDENTEIGSEYVHRANNQYSAGQATVYTYECARKLLKVLKRKGIEYTTDCFLFKQAHEFVVNGYSIKKEQNYFLKHDYKKIKSLIDPTNIRDTENL